VNEEERIRAYVRGRAAVAVPEDLRLPVQPPPRRRRVVSSFGPWARVAAGGLAVVLVVGVVLMSLSSAPGPAHPSASQGGGSTAPASRKADPGFPAEVAGLPVVTVARAIELLGSGKLDGQVVAVAGYYGAFTPSCPFPGRYIGPLESWCSMATFADTLAAAQLCQGGANGMSCQGPTGIHLEPFFMSETSGYANARLSGGSTGKPAALVLIGHAGDPRQWQCTSATQAACARAFVVDRIAWAGGHDVPAAAPQTGDQRTGTPVTPKLTLAQVAAVAGLGDTLLTAAAFRAGDIATEDPRWNLAGDSIVWLVRSIASASPVQGQEARSATIWLVDDATGRVLDSQPLKVDAAYRPARLWQIATVRGLNCCGGSEMAFYRVTTSAGTVVYDGFVPGGEAGSPDSTTFGGSYGSQPLVLPAAEYAIRTWLAPYANGVTGTPARACSTKVNLQPLDDVALNAEFPSGRACTLGLAPSPSS
jgi:hypothetical protein